VAYLVLRMAGRLIDRRPLGRLPRLTVASVVGVALAAANPFGLRLLAYPLKVITEHQAFSHIVEWESPSFSDLTNLIFLLTALLALVLLVARRGTVEDCLIVVAFVTSACLASRNVPVASLAVTPVLARGLTGMGQLDGARRGIIPTAALAVWAALGAVLISGAMQRPAFQFTAYPVSAVTYMQHHGLVPGRVATEDFVGNYLEFRYGARASAFIDDRVDMYPESVVAAYGSLLAGSQDWETILNRYRVDAVLWARSEPLAGLVAESPRWKVVWHDRSWLVAVRKPLTTAP
jgi:hypothetical protein